MSSPRGHEDQEAIPRSSTPLLSSGVIADDLRQFTRSPHPYHRSSRPVISRTSSEQGDRLQPLSTYSKSSRTPSDSGTEADDESTGVLRGLPAPPIRPQKGLRSGANGTLDTDTWLPIFQPWPSFVRQTARASRRSSSEEAENSFGEGKYMRRQRRVEILHRLAETALLLSVGAVVLAREDARSLAWTWRKELAAHGITIITLYAAYPVLLRISRGRRWRMWPFKSRRPFFSTPASFDPAPLLYPILIPIFVSLSLTHHVPNLIIPNLVLSLASLPAPVIPLQNRIHGFSVTHWMVTLAPIIASEHISFDHSIPKPLSLRGHDVESLILLFPLHQALIPTLDFLLTTSILPAELQLLATALINLFLFAASPQAEILKALLWLGGISLFAACRHILRWEVALARIPSWKFRRSLSGSLTPRKFINMMDHKLCQKLSRAGVSDELTSDSDGPGGIPPPRRAKTVRDGRDPASSVGPVSATDTMTAEQAFEQHARARNRRRRHTISTFEDAMQEERVRTTPGGRRKKSMGPGLTSFLSMTAAQAQVRKWLYAIYVYAITMVIILGPIRKYIAERALHGQDPFGWAIGYLLGNLSGVRFWVLMLNLEYWIQLPARPDVNLRDPSCWLGWVEHVRQADIGPANTRLLLSGYCVLVLVTGLAVVFQLSAIAEVDTRRKVFHGMMVLMFLPTVFVDPTFCALALTLVLAIFLLLDLFRASQLPPISRPLTYFLAPYVDGRDHRGPVIVSHIFLLIGCSIPLWLSLSDLDRTGDGPWAGWEVPARDVSMVSGIICVGMGDAAASLIGRRYGRLKWFWGGGKSLEGSVAFAVAVSCGLLVARGWLVLGGWTVTYTDSVDVAPSTASFWFWTVCKAVLAASGASATEAILTGCNDNVVVPVVLWLLVRGLGV